MKKARKPFVDIENAQRGDYAEIITEIVRQGVCPFCKDHFLKHHTEPILRLSKHWIVTHNFRPYKGTRYQFLLINLKHHENISSLSPTETVDLFNNITWLYKKFKLKGASFLMRFGNSSYTGASVTHLHAHLIVGVKRSQKNEPIRAKVGYTKK